jgi:iron complex outermembrane receptor protein
MIKRRPMRQVGLGLFAASTVFGMAMSSPAQAQSGDAQAGESEEIVVNARRREESLLDTPVAVTALPAAALDARGATDLADVANSVPNASFGGGAGDSGIGSAIIFIRGVGQTDYANSADPGVGTYIDGVYLGRTIGGVMELGDIDQVEVLRGPQGTLFGKNTIGGAINIITRRPGDNTRGSLAVTVGEDNRLNFDGEADFRLSPSIGARLAISSRNQDGFVRRLNGGDATGEEEAIIGRASVLLEPNNQLEVLLSADYSDIGGSTPRVVTNINPGSFLAALWNTNLGGFGPPPLGNGFADDFGQAIDPSFATTDLRSTNATGSFDNSYEGGGVSLRVEYSLSPNTLLRSITAYRGFDAFSESDQDGQSLDWGFVRYADEQSQVSQEFNLIGSTDRLDWIVGAYYFTEDASAVQDIDLAAPIILFVNNFATETVSYAAFGEATWRFNDWLSASIGARYTHEEKDFDASTRCQDGAPDFLGLCATTISGVNYYLPPTQVSEAWDSIDPRLGVQIRPNDNTLLYASYSTGFKSGGFNARADTPNQVLPYDPEDVQSYEIGYRGSFDQNRLQLSATAFLYDYRDFQVTYTGSDTVGVAIGFADNVGAAEIRGLELEAVVRPVRNFAVNAALGYIDSEITELDDDFVNRVLLATGVLVTTDNELPRTPELTFNLGAELTTRFGDGDILWRVDGTFVDDQFSEIQNFESTASPAHTNLNARIAYTPDSERWSLAFYGRNLTDEVYAVNGFLPNGGNGVQTLVIPNEPREIGVQLRVNFGE